MALDLRRLWPWILAVLFFPIPLLLFHLYPVSFWVCTDYQPLGLADALNMAYRIADGQMYSVRGMMDHPGVPFYFMNWLALALAGYPVASRAPGFFNTVIEHVEYFHRVTVWLAALVGVAGISVFLRTAQKQVPASVAAIALLVWLASSPATLLTFVSPAIDSFAILINGLFFAILVRLAFERDVLPSVTIIAACVGAFAYLNKLSYVYVPVALMAAGFANLWFRGFGIAMMRRHTIIAVLAFIAVLAAVGFFLIGWDGFLILLRFHIRVFISSGLYGSGDRTVVSGGELWRAIAAIPVERAFAVPIALFGGAGLVAGGYLTGRRRPQHVPVAVIAIGAGVASMLSAVFVIKHYNGHYVAGISATLPAGIVAGYLLAQAWGWSDRLRNVTGALAVAAILFMAGQSGNWLMATLALQTDKSEQALADLPEIHTQLAGINGAVEFGYRVPFAGYGEGFVIYFGSVPRMTSDYIGSRQDMFSSSTAGLMDRKVGAYVIDRGLLPTVESVKASPNVLLDGPKPVTFKDGDKLIGLRTVFLLIPG